MVEFAEIELELPATTVMLPAFERQKLKLDEEAVFTVNVNEVVFVTVGGGPPPVPVIMIGKEPVGVEHKVVMVRVLEKVGLPLVGLNTHEAPGGRPKQNAEVVEMPKVTD